jgi:beta-1,4-mannosyl-glycoprotein beta-1,4-N-acetylglucosaminyltransferase
MIVDAFTFFNEMELLEIRLNYLDPVVDKFVLVESNLTHSGNEKPLFFDENKDKFKQFWPKIVHIIVNDMPGDRTDRWVLENYQRNAIVNGFNALNLAEDDYVMISDMDEIPRRELVLNKFNGTYDMRCFMYYLNTQNEEHWNGTVGSSYSQFKRFGAPQVVRNQRNNLEPIRNGGWHFGWLGGYDRVYQKIKAFAHTEIDVPQYMNPLRESINNLCALWSPGGGPIPVVEIDDTFPDYIVNNKEKFKELIYVQTS